jgi:DNA polymerase
MLSANDLLISDAQACVLCPRMLSSRRVLSALNGNWSAQILFVAEAPGRLGAEVTGIPLFGDRTGSRFEELLRAMGCTRDSVFLTNAVLCNPRSSQGNNDKPSNAEIVNCSSFLRRTIALVNPLLVIALGSVALRTLRSIHPHECSIRDSCGQVFPWGKRHLGILYHPSPRTQTQRVWEQQLADATSVAKIARKHLGIDLARPCTATSPLASPPRDQNPPASHTQS